MSHKSEQMGQENANSAKHVLVVHVHGTRMQSLRLGVTFQLGVYTKNVTIDI